MYLYIVLFVPIVLYMITTKKRTKQPDDDSAWTPGWCNWTKSSPALLKSVETKLLSNLKTKYNGRYVHIGSVVGERDKVWTISLNEDSPNTPLVMLHGMGAGVGLWVMNLDDLAANRPVYAIDILGFGRSSRPTFSSEAKVVELQMLAFLEEWRREMKLERFILLGHSLGAYISTTYAMQYPSRVEHLILADAWGLAVPPADILAHYGIPMWGRIIAATVRPLNPLWGLRFAGPWGPNAILKMRKNLVTKLEGFVADVYDVVPNYIHQCNSQKPSGESAFHALMHQFAFAKLPLVSRMHRLHPAMAITLIFGAHSWVGNESGQVIKNQRPDSYVNIQLIEGSGHHVNLDRPEIFNKHVVQACQYADAHKNQQAHR